MESRQNRIIAIIVIIEFAVKIAPEINDIILKRRKPLQ